MIFGDIENELKQLYTKIRYFSVYCQCLYRNYETLSKHNYFHSSEGAYLPLTIFLSFDMSY